MKKLLLVVGPQGSGNHLFSKIFSLHPDVWGWKELNDTYWIQHDQEPFNRFWVDPRLWLTEDFGDYRYAAVSISVPYVQNGQTVTPCFHDFISNAQQAGWTVQVVVIGRDANILHAQQTRLRGNVTLPQMLTAIETELEQHDPVYISHELVYLYNRRYLKSLSQQLDFPIDYNHPEIGNILSDNANAKYIQYVDKTDLDIVVTKAIAASSDPGTEWFERGRALE